MRILLTLAISLLCLPSAVHAQEVTASPICFSLRNEAPYMVFGEISTDYYTTPNGTQARHNASFRLEKSGARNPKTDNYTDRRQFCSTGPFYDGRQIELTLRTLVPVFSCRTNIEMGEIVIHGVINQDGSAKTWAVCY